MFVVGQKVNLWRVEVDFSARITHILRSVIVTITEIKTGVPGEFSGTPSTSQSLRGIGDDGKVYEKHWNYWPESQTNCFTTQWSIRDDGDPSWPRGEFWIPKEATDAYAEFARHGRPGGFSRLIDVNSADIKPAGDVDHCAKHDEYSHRGVECFSCVIEKHTQKRA